MKISPQWLREFIEGKLPDAQRIAEDLTLAGIAVESVSGAGDATIFEMDITTNRVDAMNHYGIARELSAIYGVGHVMNSPSCVGLGGRQRQDKKCQPYCLTLRPERELTGS